MSVKPHAVKFNTVSNNHGWFLTSVIFSIFTGNNPFWENLVKKLKIVNLGWNLVPRLTWICRIIIIIINHHHPCHHYHQHHCHHHHFEILPISQYNHPPETVIINGSSSISSTAVLISEGSMEYLKVLLGTMVSWQEKLLKCRGSTMAKTYLKKISHHPPFYWQGIF